MNDTNDTCDATFGKSPIQPNIGEVSENRVIASQASPNYGPCHLCATSPGNVEYIRYWCADALIDNIRIVLGDGRADNPSARRWAAEEICRAVAIAKRLPFITTQIDEVDRLLAKDHRRVLDKAIRRIRELMPEQCPNRRSEQAKPRA